jgi:dihydroxyacetone kinase-like protein
MQKISNEIKNITLKNFNNISEMLSELGKCIMNVNGGSAGPLYGTIFEGFAEGLEGVEKIESGDIRKMFAGALENFSCVSTAKVGDKTMMDTLIPACLRAEESKKELPDLLEDIAEAGRDGAEYSKQCIAKFGRARFHKEATIGTMDAGAFSLACLITGFAAGVAE